MRYHLISSITHSGNYIIKIKRFIQDYRVCIKSDKQAVYTRKYALKFSAVTRGAMKNISSDPRANKLRLLRDYRNVYNVFEYIQNQLKQMRKEI